MPTMTRPTIQDFVLRVDRVGSYRVIATSEMTIGGPAQANRAGHLALLAPLSSVHASIRRSETGYTISPRQGAVALEGPTSPANVTRTPQQILLMQETYLSSQTKVQLGPKTTLTLDQPSPLSRTAILKISPAGRTMEQLNGVVLLDQLLLIGAGSNVHINSPHWQETGVLIYRNGTVRFRSSMGLSPESSREVVDVELPWSRHWEWNEIGIYLEPYGT